MARLSRNSATEVGAVGAGGGEVKTGAPLPAPLDSLLSIEAVPPDGGG